MGLGDDLGSDDHDRRAGDGSGVGTSTHQCDAGLDHRIDGVDGDGGDLEVDRGDAGESIDQQGRDAAVHGDRDLQRQQHAEHDEPGDVGLGDDLGSDDHHRRAGDGSGSGDEQHQCDAELDHRIDGADGDGGDLAVDRGDAGESIDRQGR